jgi:N-acetylmuramoyl-L-alanine amidase
MQQSGERKLQVLDLSKEQEKLFTEFDPPHHRINFDVTLKKRVVAKRSLKTVDSICVHQTATPFGVTAAAIREAGGDPILAKNRRALQVAAHMTAFDTGYAVLAHPLDWYVFHGNGLNARSIGLEVEGAFPGEKGTTDLLTGKLLTAAKDGLEYLVREGRKLGMPIKYVFAHRQSSATRPNDPGEEIWQKLVVQFAEPELGLVAQPAWVDGGGRALPDHWIKQPGKR